MSSSVCWRLSWTQSFIRPDNEVSGRAMRKPAALILQTQSPFHPHIHRPPVPTLPWKIEIWDSPPSLTHHLSLSVLSIYRCVQFPPSSITFTSIHLSFAASFFSTKVWWSMTVNEWAKTADTQAWEADKLAITPHSWHLIRFLWSTFPIKRPKPSYTSVLPYPTCGPVPHPLTRTDVFHYLTKLSNKIHNPKVFNCL